MKPNLVLMSHGNMAYETLQSAMMITGDIDGVYVVSMSVEDDVTKITNKFIEILDTVKETPTIVVVDLYGGTPCNVASMQAIQKETVRIITGLNLAMIIDYALSQETNIDTLTAQLISTGKMAVQGILQDNDDCDIEE